jgi:dTDP-4-dehydrorhamnose reductase
LRAAGASEAELAFFCERVCPPDVLGLNYYLTSDRYLDERIDRYPQQNHGGNGFIQYADVEAVRVREQGIAGHQSHLLTAWQRYQLPVAITEVHLSCTRDEQLRWLIESWQGAQHARRAGADVRAVTAWALLGSYDWDTLVTRAQDHYEPGVFDTRGANPRPTRLASVVTELASNRVPDHPVLDGQPWWRRPRRFVHGVSSIPSTPLAGRRLLITGAGTLGRAFQNVCEGRGLAAHLANRLQLDIANPLAVDATLETIQPWAVINTAGYVRVDAAETERELCHRSNTIGAITLATACRQRGIPLVTFSTDLVFDGQTERPYIESDSPRPLNFYGQTKAAAEAGVLAALPEALVIRTSAFFGPWDEANFAAQLFKTLEQGQRFAAAADSIVSPTYVPDLVHASLDLLIDGETGLWHLANSGAVTWFEFAHAIATAFNLPTDRIETARTVDICGPARRPANSALVSERGNIMRSLNAALTSFAGDATHAPWIQRACALR